MDADVGTWAAVGLELMSELVPGCRGDGEMAGHGPVLWAEPRPLTCSLSASQPRTHPTGSARSAELSFLC